jgi:hypothetical protein
MHMVGDGVDENCRAVPLIQYGTHIRVQKGPEIGRQERFASLGAENQMKDILRE